jgi:hypothetical protein
MINRYSNEFADEQTLQNDCNDCNGGRHSEKVFILLK